MGSSGGEVHGLTQLHMASSSCSTTTAIFPEEIDVSCWMLTNSRRTFRLINRGGTPPQSGCSSGLFPDITTEIQPKGSTGPAIRGGRGWSGGSGLGEADAAQAGSAGGEDAIKATALAEGR